MLFRKHHPGTSWGRKL